MESDPNGDGRVACVVGPGFIQGRCYQALKKLVQAEPPVHHRMEGRASGEMLCKDISSLTKALVCDVRINPPKQTRTKL